MGEVMRLCASCPERVDDEAFAANPNWKGEGIHYRNAHVRLIKEKNEWGVPDEDDGSVYYPETGRFTSDIRLSALYAQEDKARPRAPRGLTRLLLCLMLVRLVRDGDVDEVSIMALEADASRGGALRRMYEGMGFAFRSRDVDWLEEPDDLGGDGSDSYGGLMSAPVGVIIQWCARRFSPPLQTADTRTEA